MINGSEHRFTPVMDGVILIDCWDYSDIPLKKKRSVEDFYQSLIYNIKLFDIKYVINAMTHTDKNSIDQQINNNILANISHCSMETWNDFVEVVQEQSERSVNKWYVAGQSWNMCVHHNNIGLNAMARANLDGIEFYADHRSFLKEPGENVSHEDFILDSRSWFYYERFGYKLL
jgi:hypothetical protein